MKRLLSLAALGALMACAAARADINDGVIALGHGDYPAAVNVFMPGAQRGDPTSQNFLAHTYTLMEKFEEAYAWYYAAAHCGSLDAQIELSVIGRKMSRPSMEKAEDRGRKYLEAYCGDGDGG